MEVSYQRHKEMYPGHDPHFYLAQAWLAFMKAKGHEVDDGSLAEVALSTTALLSCIPHPECARALGILILFRERKDDLQELPKLIDEFNQLTKPILLAQDSGEIKRLYDLYNPIMSKEWNGDFESSFEF
ncbi:MAG: hypothetical protein ACREBV_05105 [Candidatus Zixiibacteriota bacterium]